MRIIASSIIGVVVGMIVPAARGSAGVSFAQGTGDMGALPSAAPGTPFSLDYSGFISGYDQPFELVYITLAFQCQTPYSVVKIVLDSSAEVFEFPPTAPSTDQTAIHLYDPNYPPGPGSIVPMDLLPPAWAQELADGTLNGALWVEDTPFPPQYGSLSAAACFLVPEPATLTLAAFGLPLLLARRRFHGARHKTPRLVAT